MAEVSRTPAAKTLGAFAGDAAVARGRCGRFEPATPPGHGSQAAGCRHTARVRRERPEMRDLICGSETDWSQRELDRIFDDPDEHGPSRHYLNPIGEPLYEKNRVRVARWRAGKGRRPPMTAEELAWCDRSPRPTCAPVLVVNFHALAEAYRPGVKSQLWGERLSHPVAGRMPGSENREEALLEDALVRLVAAVEGRSLETWKQARPLLRARAAGAVERLGPPWPRVVLRRARRSSYVPRGTGPKSLARAMDALALLMEGQIALCALRERPRTMVGLLVQFPVLRFDPLIAK